MSGRARSAAQAAVADAPLAALQALGPAHLGREARSAPDDHSAVRLWLRLFSCSTQIERVIRARLRREFGTTLPRFDYLAQLERHPEGLRMNALSRYLMVTGGNVTGLTDALLAEGWVTRREDPADRRSLIVALTPLGRTRFLEMAAAHERWMVELLAGFAGDARGQLHELLGRLRVHLAAAGDEAALPLPVQPASPDEGVRPPPATRPPRTPRGSAARPGRLPAAAPDLET